MLQESWNSVSVSYTFILLHPYTCIYMNIPLLSLSGHQRIILIDFWLSDCNQSSFYSSPPSLRFFFANDSDYLPSMPEWSWFHCIFLSHRITNLSSLYKVIISRFLSLSVWEYISLSIANLSWMPTNLFPPHLQPFLPLQQA